MNYAKDVRFRPEADMNHIKPRVGERDGVGSVVLCVARRV